MPLRYRRVTYRYTTTGGNVDQLMRRIWELNRPQSWALPAAGLARARWRPPTDVLEGPSGLLVKVEVAGMREDDIEVTLFDDVLVVAAAGPRSTRSRSTAARGTVATTRARFNTASSRRRCICRSPSTPTRSWRAMIAASSTSRCPDAVHRPNKEQSRV